MNCVCGWQHRRLTQGRNPSGVWGWVCPVCGKRIRRIAVDIQGLFVVWKERIYEDISS